MLLSLATFQDIRRSLSSFFLDNLPAIRIIALIASRGVTLPASLKSRIPRHEFGKAELAIYVTGSLCVSAPSVRKAHCRIPKFWVLGVRPDTQE